MLMTTIKSSRQDLTGTYKIPAFNDVPERFDVSLLEDAYNPFAVHSSKAIGGDRKSVV